MILILSFILVTYCFYRAVVKKNLFLFIAGLYAFIATIIGFCEGLQSHPLDILIFLSNLILIRLFPNMSLNDLKNDRVFSFIYTRLGFFFVLLLIINFSGLGFIGSTILNQIFVFLAALKRRGLSYYLGIPIILIFTTIESEGRGQLIMLALMAASGWLLRVENKFSLNFVFKTVFFAVGTLIGFGIISLNRYRDVVNYSDIADLFRYSYQALASRIDAFYNLAVFRSQFNNYDVDLVDFFARNIFFWVPRSIWDDKPYPLTSELTLLVYPDLQRSTSFDFSTFVFAHGSILSLMIVLIGNILVMFALRKIMKVKDFVLLSYIAILPFLSNFFSSGLIDSFNIRNIFFNCVICFIIYLATKTFIFLKKVKFFC